MVFVIDSVVVKKGGSTVYEACGQVITAPYTIEAGKWICITANIRNAGTETAEFVAQLVNPIDNSIIDSEPDLVLGAPIYWKDLSVGYSIPVTFWAYANTNGSFNLEIRVKRCVCTSWTGCYTACDAEPVDAIKQLVFNSVGTAPLIPGLPPVSGIFGTTTTDTTVTQPLLNDPNPSCYQLGETVPLGKSCCLGADAILQANGTYVCQKDPASSYSGMRASGTTRTAGTPVGIGIPTAPKSDSGMETAILLGVGILVAALIFKKR